MHGALARSERRDLFGNAAQISRNITFLPSLTWLPFASHRNTRNATQRRLANMTKLRAHARFGGKASKNEREREREGGTREASGLSILSERTATERERRQRRRQGTEAEENLGCGCCRNPVHVQPLFTLAQSASRHLQRSMGNNRDEHEHRHTHKS